MLQSKEAIGRAVIKYDQGDGVLTTAQLAELCEDCELGLSPQVCCHAKFNIGTETDRLSVGVGVARIFGASHFVTHLLTCTCCPFAHS